MVRWFPGKSQKEVVAVLGKPDSVFPHGTLSRDRWGNNPDDEVWTYYDKVKHEATGKLMGIEVHFRKGNVLQVEIEGSLNVR
jgi:hypothetical protein